MRPARDESLQATTENLQELLGEAGLQALVDVFGGRRLYVPANPGPHHPLTVALGQGGADKLAGAFHGLNIPIPILPSTGAEIRRLDALGWTRARIARELKITERWVYKTLAAAEDSASRQGRLFG